MYHWYCYRCSEKLRMLPQSGSLNSRHALHSPCGGKGRKIGSAKINKHASQASWVCYLIRGIASFRVNLIRTVNGVGKSRCICIKTRRKQLCTYTASITCALTTTDTHIRMQTLVIVCITLCLSFVPRPLPPKERRDLGMRLPHAYTKCIIVCRYLTMIGTNCHC